MIKKISFLQISTFFSILVILGFLVGFNLKNNNALIKQQELTNEIYPVCISDICPKYSYTDVTHDNTPETTIIIPLAMTQGFGKLVIVEEGGKKIFDSGALPNVWIKPVDDSDGFILQYSSPMDENLKRKNYEVRYRYDKGKFVKTDLPNELNTYINNRFGYAIDYPKSWPVAKVATNGDGRNLYNATDTEILIYGSYTPWTFSTQDAPVEREIIILNDGRKATYLKELKNGKINYTVFFNQTDAYSKSEVQYVFNVKVSEDFFKQHEKEIISAAKSIRLIQ